MVVSIIASQRKGSRFNSQLGPFCVGSLRVLRLPPTVQIHVRLIGVSKIVFRSECVCGYLSLCGPVMDWRPVQGVPHLSPDDLWDGLQPPRDPIDGLSRHRKWMDG